ncbi:hypothetical protein SLA2020_003960 [Shorea laevis]
MEDGEWRMLEDEDDMMATLDTVKLKSEEFELAPLSEEDVERVSETRDMHESALNEGAQNSNSMAMGDKVRRNTRAEVLEKVHDSSKVRKGGI